MCVSIVHPKIVNLTDSTLWGLVNSLSVYIYIYVYWADGQSYLSRVFLRPFFLFQYFFKLKFFRLIEHYLTLFGSSVIQKFFLHTNGMRCSQEGSHPCYSQSQIVYTYHISSLSLQEFFWPKYHFWPLLGLTWKQKWVWSYKYT